MNIFPRTAPRTVSFSAAKNILPIVLCASLFTTACVPLVLTTAAVTAVDISQDRRTTGKYLDDNLLEVKLRRAMFAEPELTGVNISVTAFNGIVLFTGEVNSDAQRQRVDALTEQYRESGQLEKVVNELSLAGKTNLSSRINDSWITGKVRARLLKAGVKFSVVKVVTEHGKVYLLGRVTRPEADMAIDAIRSISGVTHIVKVFDYIDE